MNASKDDHQQNNYTKSSSYLENEGNVNSNDDTDEDAEEIPSTRTRGGNKIYHEFKTYPDPKAATESLRKIGWVKGKRCEEKQLFRW